MKREKCEMRSTTTASTVGARGPRMGSWAALLAGGVFMAGAMGGAFAAPVAEEVEGRWQLTVPEGETYRMTADDVARIGNRPFQKAGGGLLVAGDEMGEYDGDIYVVDGFYRNETWKGFGSAGEEKKVYVQGGTILNTQSSGSGNEAPSIPRSLVLAGDGYRGFGVISNITHSLKLCYNATFTGDTKIAGDQTMNFRYFLVDLGGYRLTTEFPNGTIGLMFVQQEIRNPGDIDVKRGFCGFESQTAGGEATTMTFAEGTRLRLSVSLTDQARALHFADNTLCDIVNWDQQKFDPATGLHGGKRTCFLTGPVTLDGTVASAGYEGQGVSFLGAVSGPGGFTFRDGIWLRLANDANSFAGGVSVTGKPGLGALDMVGGLALAASHAVPANGGPLALKDATLGLYTAREHELPALRFDGTVAVTGDLARAACHAASLVKTGDGPLTVFGPLTVTGDTEIRGGTLRFATRVDYQPGLYWAHNNSQESEIGATYTPEQIRVRGDYQGVEATGLFYAYNGWINTFFTTNNGGTHSHNCHYYAGYMKIPGEPGTDVSCRFISCIARNSRLDIDGVTVLRVDDNNSIVPPRTNLDWTRHIWSEPVVLKAGWHQIYCYMDNHWLNGGPTGCYNVNFGLWPEHFGYGVNYNASAADSFETKTNALNYVKLLDPGDGSVMRTSRDKTTLDPAWFRPSFGGRVAFASGTALDIGDAAPYIPVAVPSLTGVPTIRNGCVAVGEAVWTLRAADVTGGVPLTIEGTAELTFPEGPVTVEISADELAALEPAGGGASAYVVMRAAEGASVPANTFVASAAVKAARWRVAREGATLVLARASGLAITFR